MLSSGLSMSPPPLIYQVWVALASRPQGIGPLLTKSLHCSPLFPCQGGCARPLPAPLTPAHPPPAQREHSKSQSRPPRHMLKSPPMDLHFLKKKSKCLDLTSKTFCYQIPAHFSSLIYSCSPKHSLHSPLSKQVAATQRPISMPPPLTRLFPAARPLLAYPTPLILQLNSGLKGPPLPSGRPRWDASSGPPCPLESLITWCQESAFGFLRGDTQEVRRNSWLS